MRFGLFCSTRDSTYSTNRSFRLTSLTKERLIETVSKNLNDLVNIVWFCKKREIVMFRIGNQIVPFASHESFDDKWWSELEPMFKEAKESIRGSNIRLTIHPGQFIQLGSPNKDVIENSLRELRYCFRVLDMLGDDSSVVTLHLGGAHGDKEATMDRFCRIFGQNSWLQKYLALENDEYNFNAKETLEVANRCNIGFIFDIFHHSINPSKVEWSDIKNSWHSKRAKLHVSSQAKNGKAGMHADFIDENDFLNLINFVKDDIFDVDIMVEAKAKEDAIEALSASFKNFKID